MLFAALEDKKHWRQYDDKSAFQPIEIELFKYPKQKQQHQQQKKNNRKIPPKIRNNLH